MKMKFILPIILTCALPASAQDMMHDDHAAHKESHDHNDHDHHGHDMGEIADLDLPADIEAALSDGGSLIRVEVLGMVCDFCATAMNKTIGKRDEVSAVYVDLDTKLMSVVTRQGAELDDETLEKLVKKAGYKIKAIHRDDEEGEGHASDHS